MKRLKLFISIFFIALSIPLAYFILLAYRGILQEEKAELQYFATVLFDEMEEELAELILREEKRAVDEYSYYVPENSTDPATGLRRSPLASFPEERYILGYLQNNPDGSFQTPLVEPGKVIPDDQQDVTDRLEDVNKFLNSLDVTTISEKLEKQQTGTTSQSRGEKDSNFAEKYLDVSRLRQQRALFEQEEQQVQQITRDQLLNIARYTSRQESTEMPQKAKKIPEQDTRLAPAEQTVEVSSLEKDSFAEAETHIKSGDIFRDTVSFDMNNLQVEVTPMQSLLIENSGILIFRRIVINNQVYRQGFVIIAKDLLKHLRETYFSGHPIAEFTNLRLDLKEQSHTPQSPVQTGTTTKSKKPVFSHSRTFSRPFSFLQATITCGKLPGSTARRNLNIMRVLIGSIILSGLFAIYQSARTVVDLSERRSIFVSSVTHELKTPLTNIRMYIEMLEQGIAPNREREEEYFRILGSESRRLSRLIDNVLEFSKLEKKQRRFNLQEGTFEEVIQEARDIMGEKLLQEGFILNVVRDEIPPFRYDREVMVQVLINLIENSTKFGKTSPLREIILRVRSEGNQIKISVSDTGPGIPRSALKKVFADFYRGESDLTRTIRGTGIGLSLVKKYITALGGTVKAINNKGPGCTITISFPVCVPDQKR